jgi:hypothetical protein
LAASGSAMINISTSTFADNSVVNNGAVMIIGDEAQVRVHTLRLVTTTYGCCTSCSSRWASSKHGPCAACYTVTALLCCPWLPKHSGSDNVATQQAHPTLATRHCNTPQCIASAFLLINILSHYTWCLRLAAHIACVASLWTRLAQSECTTASTNVWLPVSAG